MIPRLLTLVLALLWVTDRVTAAERAFWVWNRTSPLTAAEIATLNASGIKRLYWQAGELELRPGNSLALRRTAPAHFARLNPSPGNLQIIPVVRVSTTIHSPESFTGEALGNALSPVVADSPDGTVQIDFDCPDRLLPVYAERLKTARKTAGIKHLLITALDHWSDAPNRATLWSAVDEVFPMIYDVELDPLPGPSGLTDWEPLPVLDLARMRVRLASWGKCPIPWHAGLPAFARVTLYDAAAHSLGHLRSWNWPDLIFNSTLRLARPPHSGTTLLRAGLPTRLGGSVVPAGGFVAARWPERGDLRAAIAAADAAGARSAVLFRLPDPPESQAGSSGVDANAGGWSLPQLARLSDADPAPRLRLTRATDGTERLILLNDSDTDLPPCFGGNGGHDQRGYSLEIDAPAPSFWREALAGDFRRVTGHRFADAAKESGASAVAIPLATRLTFWFSHLPAHASLGTGLLQTAPDADPAALRYRLADSPDPASASWQPIP